MTYVELKNHFLRCLRLYSVQMESTIYIFLLHPSLSLIVSSLITSLYLFFTPRLPSIFISSTSLTAYIGYFFSQHVSKNTFNYSFSLVVPTVFIIFKLLFVYSFLILFYLVTPLSIDLNVLISVIFIFIPFS